MKKVKKKIENKNIICIKKPSFDDGLDFFGGGN
jgi:hypothetical protein